MLKPRFKETINKAVRGRYTLIFQTENCDLYTDVGLTRYSPDHWKFVIVTKDANINADHVGDLVWAVAEHLPQADVDILRPILATIGVYQRDEVDDSEAEV